MKFLRISMVLVMLVILALAGTGCSSNQVNPDSLGLKYSAGAFEGRHFEKIVDPGDTEWTVNDEVKQIPISQRSFRIEHDESADVNGAVVVPAGGKDAIRVAFELSVAFKLNTSTRSIPNYEGGMAQKFYEELCRRYKCDDTGGLKQLLRDKFYPALQAAFKDEARRFSADSIVNNVSMPVEVDGETVQRPVQELLTEAVGERFLEMLKRQTGSEYFCGPSFDRTAKREDCPPVELLISSADFENPEVQASRESKKVAQDQVDAAEKVEDSLKKPGFLEYQKIQACRETEGTCVVGLSGVGISTAR